MPAFSLEVEAPNEAIDFVLTGRTVAGDRWEELFTALPAMPIGALVDLGDGMMPATDCARFVAGLLMPESAERFELLIRDKARIITDQALAALTTKLFSAMTGRPTKPPADSLGGSSATGTTSTGGSSSTASTSVASTGQGS